MDTVRLSIKGQIVISSELRARHRWEAGVVAFRWVSFLNPAYAEYLRFSLVGNLA